MDLLNKDQLEDLEILGYPEPPKSMLTGESTVSIVAFHALWCLQLCCPTYKYYTLYLQRDGLILANTFEEPFGHIYGKGV